MGGGGVDGDIIQCCTFSFYKLKCTLPESFSEMKLVKKGSEITTSVARMLSKKIHRGMLQKSECHHFLIKTLTLKTISYYLSECYVHEIKGHYFERNYSLNWTKSTVSRKIHIWS